MTFLSQKDHLLLFLDRKSSVLLFGCSAIVNTVVFPLADVNIYAVAGLAKRNGKLMHPASLESGKLG